MSTYITLLNLTLRRKKPSTTSLKINTCEQDVGNYSLIIIKLLQSNLKFNKFVECLKLLMVTSSRQFRN